MENRTLALRIESDLQKVFAATERVRGFCAEIGFTDEEASQVQTCVAEALNNAVLHAYEGRPGNLIDLSVVPAADRLTIEVRDRGRTMAEEPSEPPDVDPDDWEALESSGRGWWIMRSWMDEVCYESEGGTNVVRMTKRRGGPPGCAPQ